MWKATVHMNFGVVEIYGTPAFVMKSRTYFEEQKGWKKTTTSEA